MCAATPSDTDVLLRLKGVSKAFGPRVLFRKVNVELRAGTVSLLTGANGAGKSTLLRIMAGLGRPDTGTVEKLVEDEEFAFLAHPTFIYSGLSAKENLLFWAKTLGMSGKEAEARADAMLERVGLARHALEKAGIFSRGMAQRLNLARVLLASPRLLLLDEPGTGLDVASRGLLHEVVKEAKERGAAVIWITHDQQSDAVLADRILTLRKKSLVEESTEQEGELSC